MDVLVVLNPRAGSVTLSRAHIRRWLCEAGHDVRTVATDDADWRRALRGAFDLVVAAGGGLFGDLLRVAAEQAERGAAASAGLEHGLRALRQVVEVAPATPWMVDVDGRDRSGRYLGVE